MLLGLEPMRFITLSVAHRPPFKSLAEAESPTQAQAPTWAVHLGLSQITLCPHTRAIMLDPPHAPHPTYLVPKCALCIIVVVYAVFKIVVRASSGHGSRLDLLAGAALGVDVQDLPVHLHSLLGKYPLDLLGNPFKVVRGQRKDRGASSRETDTAQARVGGVGQLREDLLQSWNLLCQHLNSSPQEYKNPRHGAYVTHKRDTVRLVDAVLHGLVNQLSVRRRAGKRSGEYRHALEVEHLTSALCLVYRLTRSLRE